LFTHHQFRPTWRTSLGTTDLFTAINRSHFKAIMALGGDPERLQQYAK